MGRKVLKLQRVKARAYMPRLLAAQDHRCFWCKRWLITSKELESKLCVKADHREAKWVESGVVLRAALATIDHIKPLSQGGTNQSDNLVAACWDCNHDRDQLSRPSRSALKRAQAKQQRKFREADPHEVKYRRRLQAARAVIPCRHPKFDDQQSAFLFCETLLRLGVKSRWRFCAQCSCYSVVLGENLSDKTKRSVRRKFESMTKTLPQQQVNAFYGLIG